MRYGSNVFDFNYDANGRALGFRYTPVGATTGTYYYYGVNARGDIEALYNSAGTQIASYSYDAYGKPVSTNTLVSGYSTVISVQPLRYRSYVYDNETGFYYLQSRYYDPTTCRFINADVYYETGQGFNGYNMFAYCNNNPVMYSDVSGTRHIASTTVDSETNDEKLVTFSVMNNREVPTSGTGSASEYVPSSSENYNCYAYALGETEWMYVGGSPNAVSSFDVDNVASMVMKDVKELGYSIRPIDSYDSLIFSDEYRIALRTGEEDYHFMKQHNDGSWSHKPSFCPTRQITGSNPSVVSWDVPQVIYQYGILMEVGYIYNYYDSHTLYFAVSK